VAFGSMSDDELTGIMQATIAASSAMADIGAQRVRNANVLAFVALLQRDATNAAANLARLVARAGISPTTSDLSTQIVAASRTQIDILSALEDAMFDEAFLESVEHAQSAAAATFAAQLVGASSSNSMNTFAAGLARAVAFEAAFANALRGTFDASAFLAGQLGPNDVPRAPGNGGGGSGQIPAQQTAPATTTPSTPTTSNTPTPNTPSTPNTGSTGNTGSATSMGSPGTGSGSGQGLGGNGTATGSGQDPGSGVGTGVSTP
jgi:hypothetical protein